jgi:hypothetical protein
VCTTLGPGYRYCLNQGRGNHLRRRVCVILQQPFWGSIVPQQHLCGQRHLCTGPLTLAETAMACAKTLRGAASGSGGKRDDCPLHRDVDATPSVEGTLKCFQQEVAVFVVRSRSKAGSLNPLAYLYGYDCHSRSGLSHRSSCHFLGQHWYRSPRPAYGQEGLHG